MAKTNEEAQYRDDTARIIAKMYGVTPDYVRKVAKGERNNDEIMASLVDYGYRKNKLIKAIESMIPISAKANQTKPCK